MNPDTFATLATQNFNRIPITREVLADLETPLSVYLKLAFGSNSYLFESVQGGEKWGRYSLIGLQTSTVLKLYGNRLEIIRDGKPMVARTTDDPLAEVERFRNLFSMPDLPDLPRFTGGLVGYFGYDTVRYVEPRLAKSAPPDQLGTPDVLLMASDEVAVFDNLSGTIMLVVHADAKDPNCEASIPGSTTCAPKRYTSNRPKVRRILSLSSVIFQTFFNVSINFICWGVIGLQLHLQQLQ